MISPDVISSPDLDMLGNDSRAILIRRLRLLRKGWYWSALGVAVGALVILFVVIPEIFVPDTSVGWVDAWYYVSLTLKLPERVARYRFLYQSERIGWTLPAYAFNRIAPPLIANYAEKATFFVGAIFFLVGTIKETTGSIRTAAFVSGLAALHSFFIHTFGTSYVDGPMNTYILGSLYFSTRAFSRSRRSGSALIGGMFWGAQLLTHFACIVLLPSMTLYCALTWARRIDRRGWVRPIVLELCGAILVVAGAWALYVHWGIGTIPLETSWASLFDRASAVWVRPSSGAWLQHALWLVFPTAVAAWSLVAVGRAMWVGKASSAMLRASPVWWLMLSVYACWVGLYIEKSPWLMLPFYSSYLIPFTFVALGRLAVTSVEMLSATTYNRVLVGLFVFGGVSYWISRFATAEVPLTLAFACLSAATIMRLRPRWHTSLAFPILLVVALLSVNCATADYGPELRNGYAETAMAAVYTPTSDVAKNVSRSERFEAAIASADRLARQLSGNSGRQYFFWYDRHDGLGMFYRSVTSLLFAWSTNHLLGEDFHGFDEKDRRTLEAYSDSGMRDLVVLSRLPSVALPDPRFTLQWTQVETAGGISFFAHYLAFQSTPDEATSR